MADRGTHTLRISLFEEPSVYREIEIGSAKALWNLAEAIVQAFDFDFDHAFGFYSGRTERTLMQAKPKYELFADMGGQSDAGSVKKTRIAEAFSRIGHRMDFSVRLRGRMAVQRRNDRRGPIDAKVTLSEKS